MSILVAGVLAARAKLLTILAEQMRVRPAELRSHARGQPRHAAAELDELPIGADLDAAVERSPHATTYTPKGAAGKGASAISVVLAPDGSIHLVVLDAAHEDADAERQLAKANVADWSERVVVVDE